MSTGSGRPAGRLALAAGISLAALLVALPGRGSADSPADLVFVTEDHAVTNRGCDAISVFDGPSGEAYFRGETHLSPGRLTSDSKGTVALASPTNTERVIYALSRTGSDLAHWRVGRLDGPVLATLGAIAILPDDEHVLVTTTSQYPNAPLPWLPNRPPFHLEEYRLPASLEGRRRLTGAVASRRFYALPAVLMPAAGGEKVHLLTDDAVVHTLDAATLESVAVPIPLPDFLGPRPYIRRTKANYMQAALSADGRYVFANRWAGREIAVADLVSRTARAVALRPDVAFTGGIAVDHTGEHRGLVAVHGMDKVMVYRFAPPAAMAEVARADVKPPELKAADETGPLLSLAWTRSGRHIVAATADGSADFVMLSFEGERLAVDRLMVACPTGLDLSNDVITLNRPQLGPTPTASPTASHTPGATATSTASPSATSTTEASPTPTATAQPRLYLPVVQKDECAPVAVDVVVVLDASRSMDEPARDGRRKIALAREAVGGFYALFSMPPSQAALVAFNADARVVQPLTSDVAALEGALGAVATAPLTRIDLGLAKAREELTGPNHVAGHATAILLLTDGQQHPGDPAAAIAEARRAEEDGAVLLVVGIGADADEATLGQIATSGEWFAGNVAPADLVAAVAALGRSLRCGPGG